jgi:hypothetical protein
MIEGGNMVLLANAWFFGWLLIVVVILRSLRSASSHDERFESSAGNTASGNLSEHPYTWHKCPHKMASGGQAA